MLNQALSLIRTYHDLSQTELCSEIGISNSYLSEIESGKKQPSLDILQKYSEAFDIPLSSILFFSENLGESKPSDKMKKKVAEKIISILQWNKERLSAKKSYKKKTKFF